MDYWVKVVWRDEGEGSCWAPDLPDGVRTIQPHEIPVHLDPSFPPGRLREDRIFAPSEDSRTCQGDPMVTHCRVHIAEEDAAKMEGYAVPVEQVSEKDILAVRCDAEVANDPDNAAAFFDSLDAAASDDERKRAVKDVLLQAVRRGLDPIAAEKIRVRLKLPETAVDQEEGENLGL